MTDAAPGGLPSHVAGAVAAPAGLVAAPGPAQATRVRLGELGIIAGAGYYLAIENGYFAEQGIEVEATRFTSGAEMIPSLATGQIDIGAGAISAGLLNAVARGLDLRIVSDHGHSAPGRPVGAFVVRRDLIDSGQVRTSADLRGRTIAIPSTAVSAMTDVRAYLAEAASAWATRESWRCRSQIRCRRSQTAASTPRHRSSRLSASSRSATWAPWALGLRRVPGPPGRGHHVCPDVRTRAAGAGAPLAGGVRARRALLHRRLHPR